jgi:regulatory protein
MARITLLQLQRRRTDRVNVFLDDEYAFALALPLAMSLRKGQEISQAEIDALQAEDAFHISVDRAVGLLARRPRSTSEIRRYLDGRDVPEAVVERVVDRLHERGYLDDEAFAAWWVQNRLRNRPRGRWALRQELAQRGVGSEHIAAALVGIDDAQTALDLAVKRAERYRGLDRDGLRRKLGAYLKRRGYGFDAVRKSLDAVWEILDSDGEEEADEAF